MAVTNRTEFQAWLERQPQEVCVAIAYRAAMRVLPIAMNLDRFDGADHLALVTLRCNLTSAVAAVRSTADVKAAAAAAVDFASSNFASTDFATADFALAVFDADPAKASDDARAADSIAKWTAFAATAAASSAVFAADFVSAAFAADFTYNAVAVAVPNAADSAVYADTERDFATLALSKIPVPPDVQESIKNHVSTGRLALEAGGPWTFWAKWYARAMAGDPLPWDLQEAVALIPDEVWETGPEAVAAEIARIEAEFWAEKLPQAEDLVVVEGDRFDVRPNTTPVEDQIDKMLGQVQFALDLSLQTNCGFNPMCVAYKYLRHTLDNCRDDANAIEQHFRQSRDILKRKIAEGSYDRDDTLLALIDGLDQHALQLRGTHPDVRAAYEIRVQQKLREVDDATMRQVAGGMRAFQEKRTTGRLYQDTGLDAETVEQDSGEEAKATAIRRTGGRAARANLMERASQAAKDVDASGGYKAARIGTTGWTWVEILKSVFGG